MNQRSATHGTFVIERVYPASPARVFNAWSDPAAKAGWFVGPQQWRRGEHVLDFRVGGKERLSGGPENGPLHIFDGVYHDIVPAQRIVYAYDMRLDDTLISVSLATVELEPAGKGTRMIFTEQAVFLDGHETLESRENGTRVLLDQLEAALRGQASA
jgi:uncharacterized protein YndB with AHSA1/START domain